MNRKLDNTPSGSIDEVRNGKKRPRRWPRHTPRLRAKVNARNYARKRQNTVRKGISRIQSRARVNREVHEQLPVQETMIHTKTRVNNILQKESRNKFRNIELSNSELINFAAMIYAESNNQGPRGQAAVGNVILNRMKYWRKSMNQVLFERGQFSPMSNGSFHRAKNIINRNHIEFARKILNGEVPNPIGKATFFQTLGADRSRWNWQRNAGNLTARVVVGDHVFRAERRHV